MLTMEQKTKTTGFARVKVTPPTSERQEERRPRLNYLKMVYPNGVSLILPPDLSREQLNDYIHAFD